MKKFGLMLVLLLIGASMTFAQSRKVVGTVIGQDDGQPLMGAGVLVKGTTRGVVTDKDGKFSIDVPAGTTTLTFSYLSMKTIDVPVQDVMNVILQADAESITELVVTGITTTDKRLFTGATDKLSAESVRLSGVPEIGRALEGRSAGLSVQSVSGTFGTAPKIRVRGATSIFGDSKPLWIIDGVPLEDVVSVTANDLSSGDAATLISSAIAGLNADDIESFDILKDGSATSIYGAKAMAGVIVVTTKRGKNGHSSFNYTGELTMRMIPSYNDYNIMNSQEQMGIYQEMEQKGWLKHASLANSSSSGVYGKMYQLINTYNPVTGQFALENTPEARASYLREAEYRNTDWFDILFSNNIMQTHSVSMSSGNEKSSYYASISTMLDPGWSQSSNVKRYTGNLNASYKLYKNLELSILTSGSHRKQRAPGTLGRELDLVFGSVKRDFDINPYSYALNAARTLDSNEFYSRDYADFNLIHELQNNYIDLAVYDLKFQAEIKWKILKNLEWSNLASTRMYSTTQEHHIKDMSNQAMAYRAMPTSTVRDNNSRLYSDPDDPYALPITILPQGGIYKRTDNRMNSYMYRSTVRFNQTIAEKHIINFNGGLELNSLERHQTWFRGWGLQYSMGEIPFYAYQVFKRGVEEGSDYYGLTNTRTKMAAFFANATYSWKGKYIVSGTVRHEGSNKLGKARSARWLPTWNISGAWNAHEEKFFEALRPTLSHLTLKASYSLTADSGPSWLTNSFVVIGSETPWRPYTGVQESSLYISSLANSQLTYEKKHELNIGASIGFLDNRINVDVDWYKRNNYDLIGRVNTQGIGGEGLKYGNVAEMESNGLEFSLSVKTIKPKTPGGFAWTTDFIYTHTNSKVTKLYGNRRLIDLVVGDGFAKEGYANNSLFSIPFAGLNSDGIPTFYTNVERTETTATGIYFQERDKGNGELDFLKYEGTTDPTDYGSFRNEFTWKGFKLNVFITYSFGNVIRLDPVFRAYYDDLTSMTKEFKNRWVLPGDEAYTDIPAIMSYRQYNTNTNLRYAYNSYNYSSARIAKGDFIRMKEISLEYTFPKKLTEVLKVNNLSAKVQATNLFLIYADKKLNGQDPEFMNSGGVAIPTPKQFTFTLRLGF